MGVGKATCTLRSARSDAEIASAAVLSAWVKRDALEDRPMPCRPLRACTRTLAGVHNQQRKMPYSARQTGSSHGRKAGEGIRRLCPEPTAHLPSRAAAATQNACRPASSLCKAVADPGCAEMAAVPANIGDAVARANKL